MRRSLAATTVWLTALIVIVGFAASALADPEDVANAVSREIMSPFCDGVTLHDCPSDEAARLRDRITRMAANGSSKERIIAKLSSDSEYGPGILPVSPNSGRGLVARLVPLLALVVGGLLLWRLLSRWTGPPEDGPHESVSPEDRSRIEAEMRQIRPAE